MGIPSYFSHIVRNHPNIIKKYDKHVLNVDNLYLDCNSIIYDTYNNLIFDNLDDSVVVNIIRKVILTIENYIHFVQPSKTVYIAFDGVAPLAKLDQQRSRRYKSWYQNQYTRLIFNKKNEDAWNTTAITPGTKFMEELNNTISKHFTSNSQNYKANIIFSGSNMVGEGEHKLFSYIRTNTEKHLNETTVIYGLDADLIMLSINHLPLCPKIYLYRETPHFIQSIDKTLEPNANYYLDIPEFAFALTLFMNNDEQLTTQQHNNKIYDYIFICFFLGNDFLPHFPALNIRTGGVEKMINAYKHVIGNSDQCLTDGTTIYWNNVLKLIQHLSTFEEEYIIKEHLKRNYNAKNTLPNETPEDKFKNFELTPTYERDMEYYINPVKPQWQKRYYRGLFGIKNDKDDLLKKDIALNYLQGLEWTMKYYTTGCPDWRWKYKYNYPPLLQDLVQYIPYNNTELVPYIKPNPVSEMVQLCYVLPRAYLHLLPKSLHFNLLKKYDHWYSSNCNYNWAYCRYFWESHVEMADINIDELEDFVEMQKQK
jgi:5'-3' exoribonuclease 1